MGLQGQAGVHRQRSKRRGRSGVRWREEEGKEGDEADRWGRAVSETRKRGGDACAWEGASDVWAGAVSGGASARAAAAACCAECGGRAGPATGKGKVGREWEKEGSGLGWFSRLGWIPGFWFFSFSSFFFKLQPNLFEFKLNFEFKTYAFKQNKTMHQHECTNILNLK